MVYSIHPQSPSPPSATSHHNHSCVYMTVGRDGREGQGLETDSSQALRGMFFCFRFFFLLTILMTFLQFLHVATTTIPLHQGKKGPQGLQGREQGLRHNSSPGFFSFFFVFLTFTNYELLPLSNGSINCCLCFMTTRLHHDNE